MKVWNVSEYCLKENVARLLKVLTPEERRLYFERRHRHQKEKVDSPTVDSPTVITPEEMEKAQRIYERKRAKG